MPRGYNTKLKEHYVEKKEKLKLFGRLDFIQSLDSNFIKILAF